MANKLWVGMMMIMVALNESLIRVFIQIKMTHLSPSHNWVSRRPIVYVYSVHNTSIATTLQLFKVAPTPLTAALYETAI